jgi:predicted DNA-binding transcriptional regulator AlpA
VQLYAPFQSAGGALLLGAQPAELLGSGWYSTDALADLLGVDASTVRRWRTSRPVQGPPFVRLSARVTVYSAADVEAWLRSRRVDPGKAA